MAHVSVVMVAEAALLLETQTAHQFAKLPIHSMSNNWGEEFVYKPGKIVPDVVRVIIPGTIEEIPTEHFDTIVSYKK